VAVRKLLGIAGALDVRVVFPGMSAVIQDVLPHDTLALALLTPDRSGVRIHAAINFEVSEQAEYDMTQVEEGVMRAQLSPPGAPEPVYTELRPGPYWTRIVTEIGLRSSLRVPIRAQGQPIGGLAFSSCQPAAYGEDDVALAARIADHVSLALAHEKLAEEARRTARAEERAAQLETRVEAQRAVILCEGGLVTGEHLPISIARRPQAVSLASVPQASFPPEGVGLDALERELVQKAFASARNNRTKAAKLLGLSRGRFYSLLRQHGFTEARR
jgi:transcriptional regulator with GAF, ATPase, and Fis domain